MTSVDNRATASVSDGTPRWVLPGLLVALVISCVINGMAAIFMIWGDRDMTQKWESEQKAFNNASTDTRVLQNHVMDFQVEMKAIREFYGLPSREKDHAAAPRR